VLVVGSPSISRVKSSELLFTKILLCFNYPAPLASMSLLLLIEPLIIILMSRLPSFKPA